MESRKLLTSKAFINQIRNKEFIVEHDIYKKNSRGENLFLYSLRDKKFADISILLYENYKFDLSDEAGKTAIFIAVKRNNLRMVQYFIENKLVSINATSYSSKMDTETLLSIAIKNNYLPMVKYLLSKRIVAKRKFNAALDTYLHYAARISASNDIFKELIKYKVPFERNSNGETPLHIAQKYGRKLKHETFILLLGLETEIDRRTKNTLKSYVYNAVYYNDIKFLKLLLEKGADPNIPDALQRTPLGDAITIWNSAEMIHTLLEHNADINIKSRLNGVQNGPAIGYIAELIFKYKTYLIFEDYLHLFNEEHLEIFTSRKIELLIKA